MPTGGKLNSVIQMWKKYPGCNIVNYQRGNTNHNLQWNAPMAWGRVAGKLPGGKEGGGAD